MDFEFRSLGDEKDLKKLIDFLSGQSLGYPNYNDWIMRAESELDFGYKRAFIGYGSGRVVADLIYQPDKNLSNVCEIKNMRIHPLFRRRHIGSFLFKQLEVEERGNFDAFICDLRFKEKGVMSMLFGLGYTPIGDKPLYGGDIMDTVMVKTLNKKNGARIVYGAKELIF